MLLDVKRETKRDIALIVKNDRGGGKQIQRRKDRVLGTLGG